MGIEILTPAAHDMVPSLSFNATGTISVVLIPPTGTGQLPPPPPPPMHKIYCKLYLGNNVVARAETTTTSDSSGYGIWSATFLNVNSSGAGHRLEAELDTNNDGSINANATPVKDLTLTA